MKPPHFLSTQGNGKVRRSKCVRTIDDIAASSVYMCDAVTILPTSAYPKLVLVIDALINGQDNDVDIDLCIHFVFHKR